jgi:hypothetical protein
MIGKRTVNTALAKGHHAQTRHTARNFHFFSHGPYYLFNLPMQINEQAALNCGHVIVTTERGKFLARVPQDLYVLKKIWRQTAVPSLAS